MYEENRILKLFENDFNRIFKLGDIVFLKANYAAYANEAIKRLNKIWELQKTIKELQETIKELEKELSKWKNQQHGKKSILTEEQKAEIIKCKTMLISNRKIAKKINVSEGTIRNYIKKI